MAVDLVSGVEKIVHDGGQKFVNKVVAVEKSLAPVSSGRLMASIHADPVGLGTWIVTTTAFGDNGFQYPARIEAGEGVVATNAKALHFVVHGKSVYTKAVSASSKSGFAKKTISRFK